MDDELIKVIVIGDSLVGKTSFIHRYVNNTFRADYKSTIGVDFALKMIRWRDRANIKLQLWDIAGQDRFTFMTRAYYKDARGCILLFDLSNTDSFERLHKWKKDLDSKARLSDGSILPCLLVANKSDLPNQKVDLTQVAEVCQTLNFVGWTVMSVKEGTMVKESMAYIIDVIMGKIPRLPNPHQIEFNESMVLKADKVEKKSCPC